MALGNVAILLLVSAVGLDGLLALLYGLCLLRVGGLLIALLALLPLLRIGGLLAISRLLGIRGLLPIRSLLRIATGGLAIACFPRT